MIRRAPPCANSADAIVASSAEVGAVRVRPENVANYLLGWNYSASARFLAHGTPALSGPKEHPMNGIIYLVGLIVVIMFILSFLGLR
jgi:hypothetical protein